MLIGSVQQGIEMAARMHPGARAAMGPGLDVSYAQLLDDIDTVSRFIMSQRIAPGHRALILMRATYLHALLIVALDRLGVASMSNVFVEADITATDWAQDSNFDVVFAGVPSPGPHAPRWISVDPQAIPASLPVPEAFVAVPVPGDTDPDRIVRLIRSSGTTGKPKVVALTRRMVMKRLLIHQLLCEGAGTNRHLLTMPPGTIAGYGFTLMILMRGSTLVPWWQELDIAVLIDRFQVSHLLLTPMALRGLVLDADAKGRRFDSVGFVTTGGAPLEAGLLGKAFGALGRGLWNAYGGTEFGSAAKGHFSLAVEDPRIIGPVLPFVTLEIVDADDRPVPQGEPGFVRIATDVAPIAYENAKDGREVFRGGYVYPGDIGCIDSRGYLMILGRADGLINNRGAKFMPEPVEERLCTLPGIEDAAIFSTARQGSTRVCAAVVLTGGVNIDELRQQISQLLGPQAPQTIKVVRAIPRNDMGKIIRRELPALLATTEQADKP